MTRIIRYDRFAEYELARKSFRNHEDSYWIAAAAYSLERETLYSPPWDTPMPQFVYAVLPLYDYNVSGMRLIELINKIHISLLKYDVTKNGGVWTPLRFPDTILFWFHDEELYMPLIFMEVLAE